MTTGTALRPSPTSTLRRVSQLSKNELRLLWRFKVTASTVIVTILWATLLVVLPSNTARTIAPFVLITDVTALGFLVIPALLVLERTESVDVAMRVTPTRFFEPIGVRLATMTIASTAAALVVCVAAGLPDVAPRITAVASMAILFGLIAVTMAIGAKTLTTFMVRAPLVAAPLILPTIIDASGLVDSPLLHLSPVTSALEMMSGDMSWAGLGWQLVWIAATAWALDALARRHRNPTLVQPTSRPSRDRPHSGTYSRRVATRTLLTTDRRTLLRDGLLLMLVLSVPLVTLVMRILATWGTAWASRRHGIDLTPHLPTIQAVILVIHTPVILGSLAGLLLLEDRDSGVLAAMATTRATVETLLGYRLCATVILTTVALALSLPFSGVDHPAGAIGDLSTAVAAGITSIVPALAMAAFARNRVQGVAVMKMMGLPLYLPVAALLITWPAEPLFGLIPTAWPVWASVAPSPMHAIGSAIGAVIASAVIAWPLIRRYLIMSTQP